VSVFHFGIVGRGLYPALLEFLLRTKQAVAFNKEQLALGPGALAYQSMDHDPNSIGEGALTTGQLVNELVTAVSRSPGQALPPNSASRRTQGAEPRRGGASIA